MEFMMESGTPFTWISLACFFILGVMYVWLPHRILLIPIAAFALFIIMPLTIDFLITTDEEALHQKVYELADLVETNDVDGLLKQIVSGSALYHEVQRRLPQYSFTTCNITKINLIDVQDTTAEVHFTVFAKVTQKSHKFRPFMRGVKLYFQRSENRWLITGYSDYPALQHEASF